MLTSVNTEKPTGKMTRPPPLFTRYENTTLTSPIENAMLSGRFYFLTLKLNVCSSNKKQSKDMS